MVLARSVVIELLDYKISKTYTTKITDFTESLLVVIELLDYKISKTYTTTYLPISSNKRCYRTIRLQNFKDIHNSEYDALQMFMLL